jgi:hypothetical protein
VAEKKLESQAKQGKIFGLEKISHDKRRHLLTVGEQDEPIELCK